MGLIEFMFRKIALARKRRQLREIEAFIAQLEDQVRSGQEALRRCRARADRLNAQLMLDLPLDEIVRRGQQA